MKKFAYICANANSLKDFVDINNDDELSIEPFLCETTWERQMLFFSKHNDIDGLILDSELDVYDSKRMFSGSAIAQEIRIRQLNGYLKREFPIVLFCSANNVLHKEYNSQLFDFCLEQTQINIVNDSKKLTNIVDAYRILAVNNDLSDILKTDINKLDSRFVKEFCVLKNSPIFKKVQYVLNELVIRQGLLISEDILAVRLGIDKSESKGNWLTVLASLNSFGAKNQGIFSDGWPRWWMPMVDEWWYQLEGNDTYIRFYSAEKRAKLVEEKLNMRLSEKIQLVPAKAKSRFSFSTDYWTICDVTNEPLDIEDGLMLPCQDNLYPWQDARYVSIMAAIEESLEVSDFDDERLERYKKLVEKEKNN